MSKLRQTATSSTGSIADDSNNETPSWPIPSLKEGEHYYMEDGLMVFTEHFHRARGFCCGNQCRHCPYEYVNVVKTS